MLCERKNVNIGPYFGISEIFKSAIIASNAVHMVGPRSSDSENSVGKPPIVPCFALKTCGGSRIFGSEVLGRNGIVSQRRYRVSDLSLSSLLNSDLSRRGLRAIDGGSTFEPLLSFPLDTCNILRPYQKRKIR
jgi:hypothetical protein